MACHAGLEPRTAIIDCEHGEAPPFGRSEHGANLQSKEREQIS